MLEVICPVCLGEVVLGATIAKFMLSLIIGSRLSAHQAAQQTAAQYDYFRNVSDQQLTQAAFELAKALPQYPYWEWFRILESMRAYGAIPGPGESTGITLPVDQTEQAGALGGQWYIWMLVGLGAFVVYNFIGGGRR